LFNERWIRGSPNRPDVRRENDSIAESRFRQRSALYRYENQGTVSAVSVRPRLGFAPVGHSRGSADFEITVGSRSYSKYEGIAKSLLDDLKRLHTEAEPLFVADPQCLSELEVQVRELIARVESDPGSVTAYESDILKQLTFLKARAAAGDVSAWFWAADQFDQILDRIRCRTSPFNFVDEIDALNNQAHLVRDQVVSDPGRQAILLKLEHDDAELKELRRHHEAMEEQAEAKADAARDLAEEAKVQTELKREHNKILKTHTNPLRVAAGAGVYTAYQTEKLAKAAQETNERNAMRAINKARRA
jgi:hypothetical protein